MKKLIFLIAVFAFIFFGCALRWENFTLTDFEVGDSFEGRYNNTYRDVTVTMPSGEVLQGKYSAVSGANFSFGTAQAYSGAVATTGFGQSFSLSSSGQA